MQPPPNQPRPKRPGQPQKPRNRAGVITMFSIVGVLVLALAGTATWWFTSGRYRTVPDVTSQTRDAAISTLTDSDLKPDIQLAHDNKVPVGHVIRTRPAKNQEMLRGDTVTVVVSSGRPKVPDIRPGSSKDDVAKTITSQDLRPDYDDGQNEFSDDVPKDAVITTNPEPGTELDIGSRVVIVVSKGREPKPVPDVRDKEKDDAFETLKDAGFDPVEGDPVFDPNIESGHVVRTDPPAGTKPKGDDRKITVTLSTAVRVPDLNGKSAGEAQQILSGLGLRADLQRPFGGGDGGRVFQQSPGGNTLVESGSTVTLYLFG